MCEINHNITLNNVNNNTTFCYSLLLIKGEIKTNITSKNIINFTVKNKNIKIPSKTFLINKKFKHLLELKNGKNEIKIEYCCSVINLTLNYIPKTTNYCVVPIYIVCKNHDGKFQSPNNNEENTIEFACKKIALGTKLIQTLIAEKFYENGFSRKTFQIENEINPTAPICRIFYSNLETNVVRKMHQNELWYTFGRELMTSEYANENFKYLAFISCTRYKGFEFNENIVTHEDILKLTEAHAALGGGGLAIFGTACLHTWPTNLEDVVNCFENNMPIDKKQLMDDSCYRGTYGGCFATTLGAVCHELCHTFDLGHSDCGIMGRGFDEINKEFLISSSNKQFKIGKNFKPEELHCTVAFSPNIKVEIGEKKFEIIKKLNPHPRFSNKTFQLNKDGIFFTSNCLLLLYFHRWFNEINNVHSILKLEENNNNIITSNVGICLIEIRDEISGLTLDYWEFYTKPIFKYNISEGNLKKFNNKSLIIVVQDVVGNIIKNKI